MPTALLAAISASRRDCVEILLDAGADVNAYGGAYIFASYLPIRKEGEEYVVPFAYPGRSGQPLTPLEAACTPFYLGHDDDTGYCRPIYSGDPGIVDLLLSRGAKRTCVALDLLSWSVIPEKARIVRTIGAELLQIENPREIFGRALRCEWNTLEDINAFLTIFQSQPGFLITEAHLELACQSQSVQVVERLFSPPSKIERPTSKIILAAAMNATNGVEVMVYLQSRMMDGNIPVDEELLQISLRNPRLGDKIYTLLTEQRGVEFNSGDDNNAGPLPLAHLAPAIHYGHFPLAAKILETHAGDEELKITNHLISGALWAASFDPDHVFQLLFIGGVPGRLAKPAHEALFQKTFGIESSELRGSTGHPLKLAVHDEMSILSPLIDIWYMQSQDSRILHPYTPVLAEEIIGDKVQATERSGHLAMVKGKSSLGPTLLRRLLALPNGMLLSASQSKSHEDDTTLQPNPVSVTASARGPGTPRAKRIGLDDFDEAVRAIERYRETLPQRKDQRQADQEGTEPGDDGLFGVPEGDKTLVKLSKTKVLPVSELETLAECL